MSETSYEAALDLAREWLDVFDAGTPSPEWTRQVVLTLKLEAIRQNMEGGADDAEIERLTAALATAEAERDAAVNALALAVASGDLLMADMHGPKLTMGIQPGHGYFVSANDDLPDLVPTFKDAWNIFYPRAKGTIIINPHSDTAPPCTEIERLRALLNGTPELLTIGAQWVEEVSNSGKHAEMYDKADAIRAELSIDDDTAPQPAAAPVGETDGHAEMIARQARIFEQNIDLAREQYADLPIGPMSQWALSIMTAVQNIAAYLDMPITEQGE